MVFWVFLNNLKLPVLMAVMLGLILCAVIAIWSARVRSETPSGSTSNTDAQWRQVVSLKVAIAIIVGWIVIQSIPEPDYNIRYVEKPTFVEKKVDVVKYATPQQTYLDIYKTCMDDKSQYENIMKICHSQAIAAISPPARVIYKYNSYKELFDNCNDSHDAGIQELSAKDSVSPRNERIALCGRIALEGSRVH